MALWVTSRANCAALLKHIKMSSPSQLISLKVTSRANCAALLKPRLTVACAMERFSVTSRANCAALLKPRERLGCSPHHTWWSQAARIARPY